MEEFFWSGKVFGLFSIDMNQNYELFSVSFWRRRGKWTVFKQLNTEESSAEKLHTDLLRIFRNKIISRLFYFLFLIFYKQVRLER